MRHALALVGLFLMGIVPATAAIQFTVHNPRYPVVLGETARASYVDWGRQALIITTQATAPMNVQGPRARTVTRDAALADARRQAQTAIGALKVTDYATLQDMLAAKLVAADVIDRLCAPLGLASERWDTTNRSLTLACALPLQDSGTLHEVAARLLQMEQGTLAQQTTLMRAPIQILRPAATATQPYLAPYTGVIIDATGLGYTPALLPKLVTGSGAEVWGTVGINPLLVVEKGLVGYATSVQGALRSGRVGENPLILRSIGVAGPLQGDLVLTDADAAVLTDADAAKSLAALAVIILVD